MLRCMVSTFPYALTVLPSARCSFIVYASRTIFSLCKSFNCLTHIAEVGRTVRLKYPWQTCDIWHSPSFVHIIAESKSRNFRVCTCTQYDHPVHSIKCQAAKSYCLKH